MRWKAAVVRVEKQRKQKQFITCTQRIEEERRKKDKQRVFFFE
jgi:hypothetical protein